LRQAYAFRLETRLISAPRNWFIGCDSPPTIHLSQVVAEPNAVACRVQTKFPRAIPDSEILGRLLSTAVP
jgi:hypothetical protein